MCTVAQAVAFPQQHDGIIGVAKLAGTLDDGIENGRDIGRRGCDHAQDVAASGLVGQRLREFAGFCLHFVEQPRVLDGDHGLVGEGPQAGFGAVEHQRAFHLVVAQ